MIEYGYLVVSLMVGNLYACITNLSEGGRGGRERERERKAIIMIVVKNSHNEAVYFQNDRGLMSPCYSYCFFAHIFQREFAFTCCPGVEKIEIVLATHIIPCIFKQ